MNDWKQSIRKRLLPHRQANIIDTPVVKDRKGEEVRRIAVAQSIVRTRQGAQQCHDELSNQIAAIIGIDPSLPPTNRESLEEAQARSRTRYRQTKGEQFIQAFSAVLADSDNQYGRDIHSHLQGNLGTVPTNQPSEDCDEE